MKFNFFERKAIRNQAQKDLVEKLRLERTFKPEIRSLFSRMTKDFRIRVASSGQVPRASDYSDSWQDLLRKHYNRVQKKFTGNVERQLKELTPNQNDLFLLALLEYRNNRSIMQEGYITRTSDTNMFLSIQEARQALEEEGTIVTNRTLAAAASAILARKQKGRVESIAILETQAPAESTKLFEARALSGMSPSQEVTPLDQIIRPVESDLRKTWVDMGDKKVRKSHRAANGQVKKLTEPYIVQGQEMMYPGDNSLGATIDNTMGCRCSSIFREK